MTSTSPAWSSSSETRRRRVGVGRPSLAGAAPPVPVVAHGCRAEIAIAVEVLLGCSSSSARLETLQFHVLYGFVVLACGIIYSYRHQLASRHPATDWARLFLMGLGIRAMVIGPNR